MPLSTGRKVALGCVLAAAGIALVTILSAALFMRYVTVRDIEVAVGGPGVVAPGERLDMTVRVRNTAARVQTVVDIDLADSYLSGLLVDGTEPPHRESMELPFAGGTSFTFDVPVEPGGEKVFVFHLKALREGDFSGDVDVCVNSSVAFVTQVARTVVEEHESEPGAPPAPLSR